MCKSLHTGGGGCGSVWTMKECVRTYVHACMCSALQRTWVWQLHPPTTLWCPSLPPSPVPESNPPWVGFPVLLSDSAGPLGWHCPCVVSPSLCEVCPSGYKQDLINVRGQARCHVNVKRQARVANVYVQTWMKDQNTGTSQHVRC